jgi:hypothetical protein
VHTGHEHITNASHDLCDRPTDRAETVGKLAPSMRAEIAKESYAKTKTHREHTNQAGKTIFMNCYGLRKFANCFDVKRQLQIFQFNRADKQ